MDFFKVQLILLVLLAAATGYYFAGGYAQTIAELKADADMLTAKSKPDTFRKGETGLVYDAKGKLLKAYKGEKDSYYLEYKDIPKIVEQAFVAVEDRKFYKHKGVDYLAILRAVIAMLRNGEVTQGGSTITQQLSRTVFLSMDKTWERKMEEIFIAQNLEKKYTKSQIMEFYLNNIYFGNGYYGIQAAANGYFSKSIDKLDLSQTVFLCAIPNNPSLYDPVRHKKNTLSRRDRMLTAMHEQGVISLSEAKAAKEEKIKLKRKKGIQKNDYVETFVNYCAIRALMKQQGFEFQYYFDSASEEKKYNKDFKKYTVTVKAASIHQDTVFTPRLTWISRQSCRRRSTWAWKAFRTSMRKAYTSCRVQVLQLITQPDMSQRSLAGAHRNLKVIR